MKNIRMVLEYDGTAYHGWQRQAGLVTIQQTVEEAIERMTREHVTLFGSGRTDAGVHALRQVANFRTETQIPEKDLHKGLNSLLPGDIAVKELSAVAYDFHSQHHARSKIYTYRIFNGWTRSALLRSYSWFVYGPLDVEAMKRASEALPGRRDFSSFCASGHESKSLVREVFACRIETDVRGLITFTVEADGFLKYMVRNIVGTLVEVGRGKRTPEDFEGVIKARDRCRAGVTAPPHGLFLMDVKYE